MHTRPTTHPNPHDLAAYALGKLPDADAERVARHVETCAECRQAVATAPGDSFVRLVQAVRPPAGVPSVSSGTVLPGTRGAPPADLAAVPPALASHPKFQLLRVLGQGGMGTVYLARHRVMERPVAIKVINQTLLDRPDALQRFYAEVRSAAKLHHPNIVTAYDAEQAGEVHFLVMEYVEGIDLDSNLRRKGPLPVEHACHFTWQAARGLQHAHERGMVHRDVKPHNLMLTRKGQVKILDFGLARLASERGQGKGLTQVGSFMGTPEYVAPEQARDASTADVRADIYSLGCTLYYLLTGRPPFQESTAVLLVLAHLEKEPPPVRGLRPEVPPGLADVLTRMLAKDPGQRFQLPAEVAQALAPFCKPGQKPAPELPPAAPSATSPGRGTVSPNDTSRLPGVREKGAKEPTPLPARREPAPKRRAPSPADANLNPAPGESPAVQMLADPPARPGPEAAPSRRARKPSGRRPRRRRWPWLAGGGAGAAALLLAGVVFLVPTREGTIRIELDDPTAAVEVKVDGETVNVIGPGGPLRLRAGKHHLLVTGRDFETRSASFTVRSGDNPVLHVKLVPKAVVAERPAAKEAAAPPKAEPPPPEPARVERPRVEPPPHAEPDPRPLNRWIALDPKDGELFSWADGRTKAPDPRGGVLRMNHEDLKFRDYKGSDLILRAQVRLAKPAGSGTSLGAGKTYSGAGFNLRIGPGGHYIASFNRWANQNRRQFIRFGIRKGVGQDANYRSVDIPGAEGNTAAFDDFFEVSFAAVGDRLTLSIAGRQVLEARDSTHTHGSGGFTTFGCRAEIKDMELKILRK